MAEKVFVVVWEFDIRSGAEAEFLRHTGRMETGLSCSGAAEDFCG
jgi:hypothetical protein